MLEVSLPAEFSSDLFYPKQTCNLNAVIGGEGKPRDIVTD